MATAELLTWRFPYAQEERGNKNIPDIGFLIILYTTLHDYTTLQYQTIPYPTLPYPSLPYPTLPYQTLHYTLHLTLHFTIVYYTTHYTSLHHTILHYTTPHYSVAFKASSNMLTAGASPRSEAASPRSQNCGMRGPSSAKQCGSQSTHVWPPSQNYSGSVALHLNTKQYPTVPYIIHPFPTVPYVPYTLHYTTLHYILHYTSICHA